MASSIRKRLWETKTFWAYVSGAIPLITPFFDAFVMNVIQNQDRVMWAAAGTMIMGLASLAARHAGVEGVKELAIKTEHGEMLHPQDVAKKKAEMMQDGQL